MGWMFGCGSKQEQVAELVRGWGEPGNSVKIQDYRLVGNHLWTRYEIEREGETYTFIGLCLLAYSRRDGCWGYKGIEETMGPVEVDCPLLLLKDLSEPRNEYAAAWRARVRKHHAVKSKRRRLAKSVVPGQTLRLVGASVPEVLVTRNARGKIYGKAGGIEYRIPPRYIQVEEEQVS